MTNNSEAHAHKTAAANFTRLVTGTTRWDAPSPVPGWQARDVVEHLLTWLPAEIAEGTAYELAAGRDPAEDLVGAWQHQTAEVQRILEDPASETADFSSDVMGEQPLRQAINNFYTADVFMHSWDLARATGQEHGLDQQVAAGMLAGMQAVDELMRGEHFGPKQPVADNAPAVDKLMAFIGRDLTWTAS
jgi:uncharacterized protein (TIGR03086 family)